jgi:TetR/AcrR family transcriptional regulator
MGRLKAPERRSQLIVVATQLFAERGFDATTTAAIAAAAGVSEPILYRHFRSKQELFAAIVSDVTHSLTAQWQQQTAGSGIPAKAFETLSKMWPDHLRECTARYQVIHNALVSSRDPAVIETLRVFYKSMETYFMNLLREGQEAGVFRKDLDLPAATWFVMERGIGYTLMRLSLGPVEGSNNDVAVDLSLRALLADPIAGA